MTEKVRQALEAELGDGALSQEGCECFTCLYGPKLLSIAESLAELDAGALTAEEARTSLIIIATVAKRALTDG